MEKKYWYSFSDYCKNTFGRKLYRVSLDAGMTCPNRDGKIDTRGCIFCDGSGSGDFAIRYNGQHLTKEDLLYNHQDVQAGDYIAYFQSFTNTYESVERLYFLFSSALKDPLFAGISIATRPDCISKDTIRLLKHLKEKYPDKFIWIELGLQTIHADSALFIRRGYPLSVYDGCVEWLHDIQIPVITHIIIGLPNETKEDILETIRHLNEVKTDGIKLQLLHYLKDTDLGILYQKDPNAFHVLTFEEYIDIVAACIGNLRKDIVIHRLTGDGNGELLLAPEWSVNKRKVLNQIRHQCRLENIRQGSLYESSTNDKDE